MNRILFATAAAALMLALAVPELHAQEKDERTKLAQTGMKFLSLSLDPRAAALGDAVTAQEQGATALFYNPATMAHQDAALHIAVAQTQFITDINYNMAALSFRPFGGRVGVFGLSLFAVSYPEMHRTVQDEGESGYRELGTFAPSALAAGLGYARALTDRFSVGGQVKLVRQDLGNSIADLDMNTKTNAERAIAYDFGVLYRTGLRGLNFAVGARNFASEVRYEEESFELPLTLRIGLSSDLFEMFGRTSDMHALNLTVDAEHPRDFPEQIRVGGEYTFMNTLSLRAGYVTPTDEQGISLGVGVQQNIGGLGFGADYAYTDFGTFNDFGRVHRVALQLSLR